MKLSFSDSVSNHRFSLKCIPKSDMRQLITITRREIYPNSFISEDNDSFGNTNALFIVNFKGLSDKKLKLNSKKIKIIYLINLF